MREFNNILVTGGAGFVGSNFIRYMLGESSFKGRIVNFDALTYAGNEENLKAVEERYGSDRYCRIKGNICNKEHLAKVFGEYNIDAVVNFAAETPSAKREYMPGLLMKTNINGTQSILETAARFWKSRNDVIFHHVSTGDASVLAGYNPAGQENDKNAYSAYLYYKSKASSNNAVLEHYRGYGVPATISNCVSNFGPCQNPESGIPGIILKMKSGSGVEIPNGDNLARMIYVDDHSSAIWAILGKGISGEVYNIVPERSLDNSRVIDMLCDRIGAYYGKPGIHFKKLVKFVDNNKKDNFGKINFCGRLKNELGWEEKFGLSRGIDVTVKWYFENSGWINRVRLEA